MHINTPTPDPPLSIDGETLENVEDFTYLGSVISKDNGVKKDIQSRLHKARGAFCRLRPIWKSKQYSQRLKIHLNKSNVKSILLYSSECLRVNQRDMERVEAFHNTCLRRICNIFWPQKISNKALYLKTACQSIISEIKRRRLRWLGHVLRMTPAQIPRTALRWTPPGRRKRGRPKTTWRRTVMAELEEAGLTWGEAQCVAQDRKRWREIVEGTKRISK